MTAAASAGDRGHDGLPGLPVTDVAATAGLGAFHESVTRLPPGLPRAA